MSFWKKKDNLIITACVAAFFMGLIYWYDLCCVNASFFSSKSGNPYEITFSNQDEGQCSINQFKGKPIILYFWATWCPSCVKKMGTLNTFAKKFQDKGGLVLPISQDQGGVSAVRAYYARHDYKNLGIYIEATGKLTQAFKITGIPTVIFINAQGQEVDRIVGGLDWSSSEVNVLVDKLFGIQLD